MAGLKRAGDTRDDRNGKRTKVKSGAVPTKRATPVKKVNAKVAPKKDFVRAGKSDKRNGNGNIKKKAVEKEDEDSEDEDNDMEEDEFDIDDVSESDQGEGQDENVDLNGLSVDDDEDDEDDDDEDEEGKKFKSDAKPDSAKSMNYTISLCMTYN